MIDHGQTPVGDNGQNQREDVIRNGGNERRSRGQCVRWKRRKVEDGRSIGRHHDRKGIRQRTGLKEVEEGQESGISASSQREDYSGILRDRKRRLLSKEGKRRKKEKKQNRSKNDCQEE